MVVSRQALLESRFSTVMCAPIYTSREGLSTQVAVGAGEGLKHESSVHCDELEIGRASCRERVYVLV